MKVAPVHRALGGHRGIRQTIVHTGQHYDSNMSDVFFRQLEIPQPDVNLGVGPGSHARQTAAIMSEFEPFVLEQRPSLVLVYGDVNSTIACALVCSKLGIPVGHVEAGLRSFDRSMPEEINRILTDQISDILFTPSKDGDENLAREGIAPEKIRLVGNVMIDTLVRLLPQAQDKWEQLAARFDLKTFGLITLHRPSNVDDIETLATIFKALTDISRELPLVFPVHPRTRAALESAKIVIDGSRLHLTEPLGYLEFLCLESHAELVITDSGGIQEETTYLGVPCITLRGNTERPVTVEFGTNTLVGNDMKSLGAEVDSILSGKSRMGAIPHPWDGRASERVAEAVVEWDSRRGPGA